MMRRVLAYAWASPTTLLGLLVTVVALLGRSRVSVVDGVLEVQGGLLSLVLERAVPLRHGVAAMTLGHVVLGRTPGCLERTRPHERAHVRQCEQWGPLFIPAYVAASVWAWLEGGSPYADNWFERDACRASTEKRVLRDQRRPPGAGGA